MSIQYSNVTTMCFRNQTATVKDHNILTLDAMLLRRDPHIVSTIDPTNFRMISSIFSYVS